MATFIEKIKNRLFSPNPKIALSKKCYVYGCEFEKDAIYCGAKKKALLLMRIENIARVEGASFRDSLSALTVPGTRGAGSDS
jgi:hypothetical protein